MGLSVEAQPQNLPPPPHSSASSSESEELQRLEHAPPFWRSQRRLSKQLSMWAGGSKPRDMVWERRIVLQQERTRRNIANAEDITDEDMKELKGCIELGFGFNEAQGQRLCTTLPALDLYFAVNRHFLTSPVTSPASSGGSSAALNGGSSYGSPSSDSDSWKICSPGESPQQVKTKLRHWAQAVACSVMQSSNFKGEMDCTEQIKQTNICTER